MYLHELQKKYKILPKNTHKLYVSRQTTWVYLPKGISGNDSPAIYELLKLKNTCLYVNKYFFPTAKNTSCMWTASLNKAAVYWKKNNIEFKVYTSSEWKTHKEHEKIEKQRKLKKLKMIEEAVKYAMCKEDTDFVDTLYLRGDLWS